MTLIYLNKSTIDINQRLISEELFENKTFDKIFFSLKITGQRIKVEVNNVKKQNKNGSSSTSKQLIDIEQIKDPLILQIL